MTDTNICGKLKAGALCLLLIIAFLVASVFVSAGTDPSKPNNVTVHGNETTAYPNGTSMNYTRGYIYNITINESQPTFKWIGYVGEINGEFALQDSNGYALYDWEITTVMGELYATKEGGATSTREDTDFTGGGIPLWNNLSCANQSIINKEQMLWNHSFREEDAYNRTFTNGTLFNLTNTIWAGERYINESQIYPGGVSCYGLYLNSNNADQYTDWVEVVLTDGTVQFDDATGNQWTSDVIYAAVLENETTGFDGGTYDFQILLPQRGNNGSVSNVAFYFYVELI